MNTKTNMLGACGIFLAFSQQVKAQNTTVQPEKILNDTIEVFLEDDPAKSLPGDSDKILFLGDDMEEMVKYKKADSLKVLFLGDWKKALENGQLSGNETRVYYFVHPVGKRRIKAENPEYTDRDVDPGEEIRRLDLGLPAYRYVWYDIESGYQWQIYTAHPEQLRAKLEKLSLDVAVEQVALSKKARRYYKAEVTAGSEYKLRNRIRKESNSIEVVPQMGAGLIGNTPSGVAGFDFYFRGTGKYGKGLYTIGVSDRVFPLLHVDNDKVSSVEAIAFYNAKVMLNIEGVINTNRESWFGVQGGILSDYGGTMYRNAWNAGLVYWDGGHFHYSFDVITLGYKKSIYGVSVLFSL
jgi:hypothetical protein